MAEYLIQDTTLDAIADAINTKTGGSSAMTPAEMVTAIGTISGGGYTEQTYTVTSYTTLASELWNTYIAPLITGYPAAALISVSNYDTSDNLSIISAALIKGYQNSRGALEGTRVGGYKQQLDLMSVGAHLAVGATLTVKVISAPAAHILLRGDGYAMVVAAVSAKNGLAAGDSDGIVLYAAGTLPGCDPGVGSDSGKKYHLRSDQRCHCQADCGRSDPVRPDRIF